MKVMMYWFIGLVVVAALGVMAFLQHPKFGKLPSGPELSLIQASPNYSAGEFRNQLETPLFTQGQSFVSVLMENIREPGERLVPQQPIPALDVDFYKLDVNEDMVIWLGHSSYYIHIGGLRLLLDPVFSEVASPLPFVNRAFAGTNRYSVENMPRIDYLLISHDHWDHLDYPTILGLKSKVGKVVVGLGVGSYFRGWGYDNERVLEGDWYEQFTLDDGVTLHIIPARHYSGRAMTRNQTLWVGFVLESNEHRFLFSGDSGYGPHFVEIGKRFNGFDVVSLDQGQYDSRWALIHMTPEEASKAAMELGAKALLPAHVGRFSLARHAWDEPFQRIRTISEGKSYRLLTPSIGEPIRFTDAEPQSFRNWW